MKTNPLPKNEPIPVTGRIGAVIRKHRAALRVTQEQLAQAADLSVLDLHLIETQQHDPKLDAVERLGSAMGIPLAVLVTEAALTS